MKAFKAQILTKHFQTKTDDEQSVLKGLKSENDTEASTVEEPRREGQLVTSDVNNPSKYFDVEETAMNNLNFLILHIKYITNIGTALSIACVFLTNDKFLIGTKKGPKPNKNNMFLFL